MTDQMDPRFDPIFQRGYAGTTSPIERISMPPQASEQVPPPPPAGVSGVTTEFVGASTSTSVNVSGVGVGDEEGDGDDLADDGSHLRAARRNPFIAILWLLGGALIAASVMVLRGTTTQMYGTTNPAFTDYAELQFLVFVSQEAMLAGMVTIVGLLFWHAAAYRRRSRLRRTHPRSGF